VLAVTMLQCYNVVYHEHVLSELVMLRCRGFWRKQRVKCMMWIVHSFIKQLIVTLLQQFVKFRQVGLSNTVSKNRQFFNFPHPLCI